MIRKDKRMNRVRPKCEILYCFGNSHKCYITCYPQQVWETIINDNNVYLSRKNVTIEITREDFERSWKVLNDDLVRK